MTTKFDDNETRSKRNFRKRNDQRPAETTLRFIHIGVATLSAHLKMQRIDTERFAFNENINSERNR